MRESIILVRDKVPDSEYYFLQFQGSISSVEESFSGAKR
jgi:hypothetical protein